jgi:hypothetical protein
MRSGLNWEEAAVGVAVEILDALSAAHTAGILHRDLKPANILIEPSGRVRVLDFGLARLSDSTAVTGNAVPLGTTSYIAPEIVRSAHAAGTWSDIYSCGVTLYEMLALRRPFDGDTPTATLARIAAGDATPLHIRPGTPRQLSACVEKAMERDIERRYATAAEFAADLRAYLVGGEVMARPSTVVIRTARRLQRNPVITVIGVLLIAATALLTGNWRTLQQERTNANREKALELTRRALLLEFADDEALGAARTRTDGARNGVEQLEAALEADPSGTVARAELARLYVMLAEPQKAAHELTVLEAEGARDLVIDWTRDWLTHPERRGPFPPDGVSIDERDMSQLDRLALARSCVTRQPYQLDRAAELLRPLETHPVLGPVARYLQFQCCYTHGLRDSSRAARYLQSTLALVPEHPIVVANLAKVLVDQLGVLMAKASRQPSEEANLARLRGDVTDLCHSLESCESRSPNVRITWLNHAAALGTLHREEDARRVLQHALEYCPNDPALVNMLAQVYFTRWFPLLSRGESPPAAELDDIYKRLERTIAVENPLPITIVDIARVAYLDTKTYPACTWIARMQQEAIPKLDGGTQTTLKPLTDEMREWCLQQPSPSGSVEPTKDR